MADKQTYTFSNDITAVEVSSLGAKIVVIPQDRADIYVEYDNPKDSPEFCAVLSVSARPTVWRSTLSRAKPSH